MNLLSLLVITSSFRSFAFAITSGSNASNVLRAFLISKSTTHIFTSVCFMFVATWFIDVSAQLLHLWWISAAVLSCYLWHKSMSILYTSHNQEMPAALCVYFWRLIWTSQSWWWFYQYIQVTHMNLQFDFHQWNHWNCTFFVSSIFYSLIQQLLLIKVDNALTLWLILAFKHVVLIWIILIGTYLQLITYTVWIEGSRILKPQLDVTHGILQDTTIHGKHFAGIYF